MLTFGLTGGFSDDQIEQIYAETLRVLEEIGMEVKDPGIRAFLAGVPGLRATGERICYAPKLVEEWIEVIRRDNLEYSYNRHDRRIRMVGPYMGQQYHDPDTGEVRYATADDMRVAVKLCDALDMYGPSPIHLQTVPPPLRQVTTQRICLENSREIGGWGPAASEKDAYWQCRISEAAGRPAPHCCMEIPISPLRLNVEALRMVFSRRGRDDQLTGMVIGGGAVPMPGATAPIFVPGCFIQAMAEALAAYITPQLIDPRVQGYCSFGGFLFDLRRATTGNLFPESVLYNLLGRQVIERFLGETMGSSIGVGAFNSPQAALSIGFKAACDVLAGARSFLGVGGYGDGFCPVSAILTADIVKHLSRFIEGREYRSEPGLSLEAISEALADGTFLAHPTTLDCRKLYIIPELVFEYSDHDQLLEAAAEKARETVAAHDYCLADDVLGDIEEVYRAAERDLLGG